MLKRKIEQQLQIWKEYRKQALLITGARQIGKTYSIENFIENNFENNVKINFAIQSELIDMFAVLKNSDDLIVKLSAIDGKNLIEGKTVIFFDEIQLLYKRREELKKIGKLDPSSQDIITAMKALSIDAKYRFILSGSLLGVTINDVLLNPTGYLDIIEMYPLDFEEYLWAKNVGEKAIEYLKKCFEEKIEVDNDINKLFLDYFNEYVLIGGMPEAVNNFLKNKNIYMVNNIQSQIINGYLIDITTYINDDLKKLRVRELFNALPSELNSKNKRYVSSHVIDDSYLKNNSLTDEFLWLTNSGIAISVYNVTEPIIPLTLSLERKTMKLFMDDIGLLDSMLLSSGIREKILSHEKVVNYGAPFENVCAQELYAHGFKNKLYYYNSKKNGEVDFVIEYKNDVLPIEIKSGKTNDMEVYNHTALNNMLKKYPINNSYIFGECNVKKETDRIYQLPIYMISFINND